VTAPACDDQGGYAACGCGFRVPYAPGRSTPAAAEIRMHKAVQHRPGREQAA